MFHLFHSGVKYRSGRYHHGEGETPHQHDNCLGAQARMLKDQGYSEKDRALLLGFKSTTELRAALTLEHNREDKYKIQRAQQLKEHGYGWTEIARIMSNDEHQYDESTIRGWLSERHVNRANLTDKTVDILKSSLEKEGGYIDLSPGLEYQLDVTSTRLESAVDKLKEEGYEVHTLYVPQLMYGNQGNDTTIRVLAPEGTTKRDILTNMNDVHTVIARYDYDNGEYVGPEQLKPPVSVDGARVFVRYKEDGGDLRDGTIEIRPGSDELSLGGAHYAQVRIAVNGTHYMKGMAYYSDEVPEGYDFVYNSNKKQGTPLYADDGGVFKKMDLSQPNNPFKAAIRLVNGQREWTDENGEKHLSPINIINQEGDWANWGSNDTLASQFLSKQPIPLVKQQLKLDYDARRNDLNEILSIENPEVKRKLLETFADNADTAAYELKAAGLSGQSVSAILPLTRIDEHEVYAPRYIDGDKVVLLRYPHAGRFELPELTVNNQNEQGKKVIGNSPDTIGINPKTAGQLSGADFDGDTVIVLPNNDGRIKVQAAVKELSEFDTKQYKLPDDAPRMTKEKRGLEMGVATNMIMDMTLQDAPMEDVIRAVKYSMVVIDAEKHHLDYKQAAQDYRIDELHEKYQGKKAGGAATLISKAKSPVYINERKEGAFVTDPETGKTRLMYIDPDTGKKLYTDTGRTTINKRGKEVPKVTEVPKLSMYDDARDLSSGHPIEEVYASYSNGCKALANEARKATLNLPKMERSPSAAKMYQEEVNSLNEKVKRSMANKPYEHLAQIKGNILYKERSNGVEFKDKKEKSKLKDRCLKEARQMVGAHRTKYEITEREWKAIESGAISATSLRKVLATSDMNQVRKLALPKTNKSYNKNQVSLIRSMSNNGKTLAQIGQSLGISTTTVSDILRGEYDD